MSRFPELMEFFVSLALKMARFTQYAALFIYVHELVGVPTPGGELTNFRDIKTACGMSFKYFKNIL